MKYIMHCNILKHFWKISSTARHFIKFIYWVSTVLGFFYLAYKLVQRFIYFTVLFLIFVIYIKGTLSGQICCLKRSNVILRSQINGFPPSQYLTHALSPASQFDTHRAIKLYLVQSWIFFSPKKLSKSSWLFVA